MGKNKNPRFRYALKKTVLIILHLLALTAFVAGVSLIYCNENFKKGIRWMNSESYEDSPAFSTCLENDIESIFDYIRYRDVFETNGKLDTQKEMFSINITPGTEQIYTLDDVMQYAKSRGYYLDNGYRVVADPTVQRETSSGSTETYLVNWRSYRQDVTMTGPGDAYMTLDALTAETLSCLGKYSDAQKKFNSGSTNVYYKVAYESETYTNLKSLNADSARGYGKYAICTSENALPDNNLSSTPTALTNLVSECNPDKENPENYTAMVVVDTTYPNQDEFYTGRISYANQRTVYFYGLILMISGLVLMLVSFILLVPMSGRSEKKSREAFLLRPDRLGPEANLILCGIFALVFLFLAEKIGHRLLHMVVPQNFWHFAEQMLSYIVIYLCALVLLFSLIREYRAGILWKSSLLKRFTANARTFFRDLPYAKHLAFNYCLYLTGNIVLVTLACRELFTKHTLISRFEAIGYALLLILMNAFLFHRKYKKESDIDDIAAAIRNIAAGDTDYQLNLSDFGGKEADMADSLNHIGQGLQTALNEQVRSERMKAELITNVSHDIKTPLTSIINYVDLIKREHPESPRIQEYLRILDQKSQHLKTLTEDLVEASKASTGNIAIDASDIDFVELAEQTNGEFEERFAARGLDLVAGLPKQPILIHADGQHLWRVLENLYSNAYKYAADHSRIYVDMTEKNGRVSFTIKNVSAHELNISPEELTERFVRGDVSRTTEGSGLGLSIAKSLTELQGGTFEIMIDGDLFKASVSFAVVRKNPAKTG